MTSVVAIPANPMSEFARIDTNAATERARLVSDSDGVYGLMVDALPATDAQSAREALTIVARPDRAALCIDRPAFYAGGEFVPSLFHAIPRAFATSVRTSIVFSYMAFARSQPSLSPAVV